MKKSQSIIGVVFTILIALVSITACNKDIFEDPELIENLEEKTEPRAVYGDRSVWFTRPDGTYTWTHITQDFGNINGVSSSEQGRHYTSSNTLRIKLLKNALTGAGGVTGYINISSGTNYTLEYKVKFQSGFTWAHGGKIPGLGGGAAYSGCQDPSAGDGWSFRVMWRQWNSVNNGKPYLEPYTYYKGFPGPCGDSFGKRYTITDNTWYTVKIKAKMNTGSNYDGAARMWVNGTEVYSNKSFRWVTKDSGRNVNRLMWDIYRGGSTSDYMASTNQYIYFDNFIINKL